MRPPHRTSSCPSLPDTSNVQAATHSSASLPAAAHITPQLTTCAPTPLPTSFSCGSSRALRHTTTSCRRALEESLNATANESGGKCTSLQTHGKTSVWSSHRASSRRPFTLDYSHVLTPVCAKSTLMRRKSHTTTGTTGWQQPWTELAWASAWCVGTANLRSKLTRAWSKTDTACLHAAMWQSVKWMSLPSKLWMPHLFGCSNSCTEAWIGVGATQV